LKALDKAEALLLGVDPKKANRKIYALLNGLKGLGDLGQHQAGMVVSPFYAAAACIGALELAAELALAGIA